MRSAPRVSVLVPTYRYAAYLEQAIRSVLSQDFTDFELIVSDDASGDGSAERISDLAREDSRIRAFVQPQNMGMVAHWNWCLSQATGTYVKFLFGDDYLANDQALGQLVQSLEDNPSAVLATGQRIWVDRRGQAVSVPGGMPKLGRQTGLEACGACMQADRNLIGEPSAVLFRRNASRRGFDPSFRQLVDLEMWYHLLQSGDLVVRPETISAFRVHSAQQSALNSQSRIASVETLRLASRYQLFFRAAFSDPEYSQRLSSVIYYARKQQPRPPQAELAEDDLLQKVGPGTYRSWLWRHRLSKPLANLRKKFR
jgi:glycosyltransferase involved in cell wall biosynthesis